MLFIRVIHRARIVCAHLNSQIEHSPMCCVVGTVNVLIGVIQTVVPEPLLQDAQAENRRVRADLFCLCCGCVCLMRAYARLFV